MTLVGLAAHSAAAAAADGGIKDGLKAGTKATDGFRLALGRK